MDNRRFGIEIECNIPGGYMEAREILIAANLEPWARRAEWEGSLPRNSGVEIRSPILQGREGFLELKKVYKILNKHGFWMSSHCGMHVHHDAPEWEGGYNLALVRQFLVSWEANQENIAKMVARNRLNNTYCKDYRKEDISNIINTINQGYTPYYEKTKSVNLKNLSTLGTIEIRKHEGTTNYAEAEAWIIFGQKFIKHVLSRRRPVKSAEDTMVMLSRIKTPIKVRSLYEKKIAIHR